MLRRKRVPLLALAFAALALLLVIAGPNRVQGHDAPFRESDDVAYDAETVGLTVTMSADDHVVWQRNGKTTLRLTLSRPLETGESVTLPLKVSGGQVDKHWNLNNHAGTAVQRTGYGSRSTLVIEAGGQEATLQFVGRKGDRKDRDITIAFGKGKRPPRAAGIDGALELQGSPLTITVAREKPGQAAPQEAPPGPEITISGGAGITEGGYARFTISANPAPASPITVNIGVSETGDWDATGAAKVSINSATTTYNIVTNGDQVDEADGSVTATVQSGNGYTVGNASSASVNVSDDDAPPPATPEITISGGSGITEGDTATFTITADPAPANPLTVNVGVTQTGDYGASGATTVSISGATTTYTVSTTNDEVDEANGSVTARVKAGQGYTVGSPASATVAVADDDVPEITIDSGEWIGVLEGNDAPFVIKAAPVPASPITVNVKVTEDGDFGASGPRSVTVTKAETAYLISTTDDETHEEYGHVRATIMPGVGYTVGKPSRASVGVKDNDVPPPIYVSVASATDSVEEGKSVTFTLTADPAPTAPMKVTVTVTNLAIADYGVKTGRRTVMIPTSGSASLTVATSDDNVDEVDGAVTVTIQPGAAYTIGDPWFKLVTIKDNDADTFRVLLHKGSRSYDIIEGQDALYTIEVIPAPTGPLTVNIKLTEKGDFGASGAKSVTVTKAETTYRVSTTDDKVDEPDGSVTARIIAGKGYNPGWPSAVEINIKDASTPLVSISAYSGISEGGTAIFTLNAKPAPAAALAVTVQVTAFGDYSVAKGHRTVTIPTSGSTTISVRTVDDDVDEPHGRILATLQGGRGYLVKSPNTAIVWVNDND